MCVCVCVCVCDILFFLTESTDGSFFIPQTILTEGENCIELNFTVLCVASLNVITFTKELKLQIETTQPPTVLESQFIVTVVSISPENYATLVPNFPLLATFEIDEAQEYLVIRVTSSSNQNVQVIGYSLNGETYRYQGNHYVGKSVCRKEYSYKNNEFNTNVNFFGCYGNSW